MKDLNKEYEKEVEKALKAYKNSPISYFIEECINEDYFDDEYSDDLTGFSTKYLDLKKIIPKLPNNGFEEEYPTGIYESSISDSKEFLEWIDCCLESSEELMDGYNDKFEDGRNLSLSERIKKSIEGAPLNDELKVALKLEGIDKNSKFHEVLREFFSVSERSFGLMSGGDYDFATCIICKFENYILIINISFDDNDYGDSIVDFSIDTRIIEG